MPKTREMSDAKFMRLALEEGSDLISAGRNTRPLLRTLKVKSLSNPRYRSRAQQVLKKKQEVAYNN